MLQWPHEVRNRLDLKYNDESLGGDQRILSSTRFEGKPEGISNVFLTYFDYFSEGQYKLGGWEAPEGGGLNPQPPTNRALILSQYLISNFFIQTKLFNFRVLDSQF